MTQAEIFKRLGAPLKNQRWSWGGVRESDRTVFLRVWQDGTMNIDNKRYIWVADKECEKSDLGSKERLSHVELIKSGYKCYMVMCQAVDTEASPRAVARFNRKELFVGGELIEKDGAYWMEFVDRISIGEIAV